MSDKIQNAIDATDFQRIDHVDGSISYQSHSDIDLYDDTVETINNPTFITIEGVKAKGISETIKAALEIAQAVKDDDWQPIETAPKNTPILILPIIGMGFVGDVWDCSMRSDIDQDLLVRHRLQNGMIFSMTIDQTEGWKPIESKAAALLKERGL